MTRVAALITYVVIRLITEREGRGRSGEENAYRGGVDGET